MADPTPTAADVLPSANATVVATRLLGATGVQGNVVYVDSDNSNVLKLAQCDGTALEGGSAGLGILLTAGATGQKAFMATADPAFDPGFVCTEGEIYVLSATAGAVGIDGDLVTGNRLVILGVGNSDGTLNLDITVTGTDIQ